MAEVSFLSVLSVSETDRNDNTDILRNEERSIDFQWKRVLKWISTDYLGMSVNVSVESNYSSG